MMMRTIDLHSGWLGWARFLSPGEGLYDLCWTAFHSLLVMMMMMMIMIMMMMMMMIPCVLEYQPNCLEVQTFCLSLLEDG